MSYVDRIVEVFGGVRPMARRLRKPASTVSSWKDRGTIPDAEKPEVLAAAHADGLGLTPADFFPGPVPAAPVQPVEAARE